MKNLRRYALNILGIIIFGVFAVVTIIVARGNRIDLNTGAVIETGTIRIFSQPEDQIKVFINEKETQLTEKRVEGIDPGTYQLRIQHTDYTSWVGQVEVKPGFITDLSVKLFPVNLKLEQATQSNIDQVVFDESGYNAIYAVTNTRKGSDLGIWRRNLQTATSPLPINNNDRAVRIANFTDGYITSENYQLVVSPNGERALLANKDFSLIYQLDTSRSNELIPTNQIQIDYKFDQIRFIDQNTLLISVNNSLIEYNLNSNTQTLLYYHQDKKPIYTLLEGVIYWLNVDQTKVMSRSGGVTTAVKLENIVLPKGITRISIGSAGKIIILEHANEISFIETTTSYMNKFSNLTFVSNSSDGQFLLAKQPDNKIIVIETDISQVSRQITHKQLNTSVSFKDIANGNIRWNRGNSFFTFIDETGNIVSMDSRTNNRNTLVKNDQGQIKDGIYAIGANSDKIMVLLQDGAKDALNHNLYRLSLNGN